MKLRYSNIAVLLLLCFSCIDKSRLKPIVPEHVLHAHSSKVWILKEMKVGDTDTSPARQEATPTLTFFDDDFVYEQELINLGGMFGRKAQYALRIDQETKDTVLSFYYKDSGVSKYFNVKNLEYKSLTLESQDNSGVVTVQKFIPLPRPF
jgi:hypothetical protein